MEGGGWRGKRSLQHLCHNPGARYMPRLFAILRKRTRAYVCIWSMYVHVYMHTHLYVHLYAYSCRRVCIMCLCACPCAFVCVFKYLRVHGCIRCMCESVYVCMPTCIHSCTHMFMRACGCIQLCRLTCESNYTPVCAHVHTVMRVCTCIRCVCEHM